MMSVIFAFQNLKFLRVGDYACTERHAKMMLGKLSAKKTFNEILIALVSLIMKHNPVNKQNHKVNDWLSTFL